MLARNRTWIRLVIESRVSQRFCTTGGNVVVSAVSAVYDRATFVSGWAKCAVIDRAYSGKWGANSMLCKAWSGLGRGAIQ